MATTTQQGVLMVRNKVHLYPLWILLVVGAFEFLVFGYGIIFRPNENLLIGLMVAFGISPLLVIAIHIQYFLANRKFQLSLDEASDRFFLNGECIEKSQIMRVEVHGSPEWLDGERWTLPSDGYHYTLICLRDGRKMPITNLLCEEFDLKLPHITERVPRIIAFL